MYQLYKLDDVHLENLTFKFVPEVIELLQEISSFMPKTKDEELFKQFISQSNVISLVAHDGNKVLGFGAMVIYTNIRGGKIGFVEDIVTHPEFRKIGIGFSVLGSLRKTAIILGCYKISLFCKDENIEFYKKCGFNLNGNEMRMQL